MTARRPAGVIPPADHRAESGMVTLEVAVAIPLLATVAAALVWCVCLGAAYVSLGDTAFSVARRIARGEAAEVVMADVQGPDVIVSAVPVGGAVEVTVERTMRPPLGLLAGLSTTLRQSTQLPMEW